MKVPLDGCAAPLDGCAEILVGVTTLNLSGWVVEMAEAEMRSPLLGLGLLRMD